MTQEFSDVSVLETSFFASAKHICLVWTESCNRERNVHLLNVDASQSRGQKSLEEAEKKREEETEGDKSHREMKGGVATEGRGGGRRSEAIRQTMSKQKRREVISGHRVQRGERRRRERRKGRGGRGR